MKKLKNIRVLTLILAGMLVLGGWSVPAAAQTGAGPAPDIQEIPDETAGPETEQQDSDYGDYLDYVARTGAEGLTYSEYVRILTGGQNLDAYVQVSGYVPDGGIRSIPQRRFFMASSTYSGGWSGGSGAGGDESETLGAVITNVFNSTDRFPLFLEGLCYLMGIFFGFSAILKLREHVDSPNNTPIWEPVKRFITGGGFLALPYVVTATMNTLTDSGLEAADYEGFNSGGASELGLDGMMVRLIEDIWTPMHNLMFAFSFIAGIFLIILGISRLLKSEQDGPRGPAGIGTILTFLVGGALLTVHEMVGSSLTSLFDTNISSSNGVLNYTAGMDQTELDHAHAVIAAIVAFVAIIGWISFIRGLFILRGVAEGNSQASMMAAITHILGGAIAVNLGGMIMAVQNTLGITEYGITFG